MGRHLRALLALPFVVLVVVPATLLTLTRRARPGWGLPPPLARLTQLAGGGLLALGLTLMTASIRLFMRQGEGTLAPWDATQRLVVSGPYRRVRNPMISGVICALLGEATLSGSRPVLGWALIFAVGNALYIPLSEEPGLVRRFGEDYAIYRVHVPRWLPRLTPWTPPWAEA